MNVNEADVVNAGSGNRQHELVDVRAEMQVLDEIRSRSMMIQGRTNAVGNAVRAINNFPAYALQQVAQRTASHVMSPASYNRFRLISGIAVPILLGVVGVNLIPGLPIGLRVGLSAVGTAVGVKAFTDVLARASVMRRTNREILSLSEDFAYNGLKKSAGNQNDAEAVAQIGSDIRGEDIANDFTVILGQGNRDNLRNALNTPEGQNMIRCYARAVAERAVAFAAHDNIDMAEIQQFLEHHTQGIAALIAVSRGHDYTESSDVQEAQNMLNAEIQRSSRAGKWFTAIRWAIGALAGLIVGWITSLRFSGGTHESQVGEQDVSAQKAGQVGQQDASPQKAGTDNGVSAGVSKPESLAGGTTKAIGSELSSDGRSTLTGTGGSASHGEQLTQAMAESSSLNVYEDEIGKLIKYIREHRETLEGKNLREIMRGAGIRSDVQDSLLKSFGEANGYAAFRKETLGYWAESLDVKNLAEHVYTVRNSARELLPPGSQHLYDLNESFKQAKLTPGTEDPMWRGALQKLQERLHSVSRDPSSRLQQGIKINK